MKKNIFTTVWSKIKVNISGKGKKDMSKQEREIGGMRYNHSQKANIANPKVRLKHTPVIPPDESFKATPCILFRVFQGMR